jgi:hypothetical protein
MKLLGDIIRGMIAAAILAVIVYGVLVVHI